MPDEIDPAAIFNLTAKSDVVAVLGFVRDEVFFVVAVGSDGRFDSLLLSCCLVWVRGP